MGERKREGGWEGVERLGIEKKGGGCGDLGGEEVGTEKCGGGVG